MKHALLLTAGICLALTACYDDSALTARLDNHESRIKALEQYCEQMNGNIDAMQKILQRLQDQDYCTGVTRFHDGYGLHFSVSGTIYIYDGKDGNDGHSPKISVKPGDDGILYWTLDGEWLLDANGQKIPVTGKDGKDGQDGHDGQDGEDGEDGITPRLKIENEYWWLSMDNGQTWTQLVKATGEDGKDGKDGDSFFEKVEETDNAVILTLTGGQTISIPKLPELELQFDHSSDIICIAGTICEVPYILRGAIGETLIETLSEGSLRATVAKTSETEGLIRVAIPEEGPDGKVLVFACNNGRTVFKALTFEEGVFSVSEAVFEFEEDGGEAAFTLSHNVDFEIESSASWLSAAPADAKAVTKTVLILQAEPMTESFEDRIGTITLRSRENEMSATLTVTQKQLFAISETEATLLEGETLQLTLLNRLPNQEVTWTSADESIATVDENGLVTAVAKGSTTIEVDSADGKHYKTCTITVKTISDMVPVWFGGGAVTVINGKIQYGSQLNWFIKNGLGEALRVVSMHLTDGTDWSTSELGLDTELAAGGSTGWGVSVPVRGLYLPVTAHFKIQYKGTEYSVSGTYNF